MICVIIYLCILAMSLGIAMVVHGKPRSPYNFWVTLVTAVIELLLLWGMGVFDLFTK